LGAKGAYTIFLFKYKINDLLLKKEDYQRLTSSLDHRLFVVNFIPACSTVAKIVATWSAEQSLSKVATVLAAVDSSSKSRFPH
jgi:hypothetical protein